MALRPPEVGVEAILRRASRGRGCWPRPAVPLGLPLAAASPTTSRPSSRRRPAAPAGLPHTSPLVGDHRRPYPAIADEVRALAIRHLVEPVRFRALVRAGPRRGRARLRAGRRGQPDRLRRRHPARPRRPGGQRRRRGPPRPRAPALRRGRAVGRGRRAALGAPGPGRDRRRAAPRRRHRPTPAGCRRMRLAQPRGDRSDGPARHPPARGAPPRPRADAPVLRRTAPEMSVPGAPPVACARTARSPLEERLAEVMGAVGDASREVVEALDRHPRRTRAATATHRVPTAPSAASGRPPACAPRARGPAPAARAGGDRAHPAPSRSRPCPGSPTTASTASPPTGADVRDRFPVVPMTTMVELMARRGRPGRPRPGRRSPSGTCAPSAGCAVAPPVDVDDPHRPGRRRRGRASAIDGYARTVAVLADAYPPRPAPAARPADRRPPHRCAPPSAMYGATAGCSTAPTYQGVAELGPARRRRHRRRARRPARPRRAARLRRASSWAAG